MTEIATPRLKLRRFEVADAAPLARLYSDDVVMRHMLPGKGYPLPEAEARAQANIANYNQHWRQRGFGVWAVESRPDGRLLGQCGLRFIDEVAQVEVLYLLNKTVWGLGLASEAARAAIAFGFREKQLARIIGLTLPENAASRRVLAKVGLTFEREAEELWGRRLAWHGIDRATWDLQQSFAGSQSG